MKRNRITNYGMRIFFFGVLVLFTILGCTSSQKVVQNPDNDITDLIKFHLKGPVSRIEVSRTRLTDSVPPTLEEQDSLGKGWQTFDRKGYLKEIGVEGLTEDLSFSDEYNSRGLLRLQKRITSDGHTDNFARFNYDHNARVSKLQSFRGNGSLYGSWEFEYHTPNGTAEAWYYTAEGQLQFVDVFNEDHLSNTTTRDRYDRFGGLIYSEVITRDERGEIMKIERYNESGELEGSNHFEYEYDAEGNWITQIEYQDDTPIYKVSREIKYYTD